MSDKVDFWFDPLCPWAWMTSRWMGEVQQRRDVEVDWRIISLGILNENNPDNHHHGHDESMWMVRVIQAAAQAHGDEYRKKLYDAMGTRWHVQGYGDEKKLVETIAESLEEVGLPAELIEAKDSTDFDAALRESTEAAQAVAGKDIADTPRPPATAPSSTGRSWMMVASCAPETSTIGPPMSSAESTRWLPTSPRAPEPMGPR